MVGEMENYKVLVTGESESKEVQDLFFELGGDFYFGGKLHCNTHLGLVTINKDGLMANIELGGFDYVEITLQQLRDLVIINRNDVNDAKYIDSHLFNIYINSEDKIYYFEHRQFNNGQYHTWVESGINGHRPESLKDEYISKLKPIENEVKMKGKEYIAKVSDDWRLVESHELVSGRIEVPEGAEEYRANRRFYKNNGELYYSSYGDWEKYYTMSKYITLWQRNHETPNTSIQDKLKFIEKWLNGEKIQYILGIESEKTQWHNFTEGAMQYIKRSDIKFREAPKYVTINGIEFKNVKSLLKHVKNNFDLEDGE